jgi:hypothetical protein
MQKKTLSFLALAFLVQVVLPGGNLSGTSAGREGFLSRNGSSRSVFDARQEF